MLSCVLDTDSSTSLLSARLFCHVIATACKFLVLAQVTVFFSRLSPRLRLITSFLRIPQVTLIPRLRLIVHVFRACHRLHFFPRLSPRMRLITCFPRMSQLTFFPALATDCTWFPRLPQVTFFPPLSPLLRLIVQVSSACHGRLHFPRLPLPTFQTFCSVSQGVLCKPLLLAARGGHKDIVEFLLEKGASPTEEDTVKLKTRLINLFTVTINPLLIFP